MHIAGVFAGKVDDLNGIPNEMILADRSEPEGLQAD